MPKNDEAKHVDSHRPPLDRHELTDRLRNVLYPAILFGAVAMVWAIGWGTSLEAKANAGYWPALVQPAPDQCRYQAESENYVHGTGEFASAVHDHD